MNWILRTRQSDSRKVESFYEWILFTARISISASWPNSKIHSARTIACKIVSILNWTDIGYFYKTSNFSLLLLICVLIKKGHNHAHPVPDL